MSTGMPDEHRQQTASTRRLEICGGRLLLADVANRQRPGTRLVPRQLLPRCQCQQPLHLFHSFIYPACHWSIHNFQPLRTTRFYCVDDQRKDRCMPRSKQSTSRLEACTERSDLMAVPPKKSKAPSWTDLKKPAPEGRRSLTGNE